MYQWVLAGVSGAALVGALVFFVRPRNVKERLAAAAGVLVFGTELAKHLPRALGASTAARDAWEMAAAVTQVLGVLTVLSVLAVRRTRRRRAARG
ncbi:hypothetical protein [Streptomyces sp. NPDC101132]|uniref:hypothetical protein n=1 Tax=Streptomyces sp. NPDC101132 TaxID=3366110 RepID=UPI0038278EB3